MEIRWLSVTSLAVFVGLSWPAPVASQDAATDDGASVRPRAAYREEITVRAEPLRQIDERALDEERRSLPIVDVAAPDQLGRFPDRDAAGAAQRLPGVTVVRDQGDARLVLVRGFLPAYNSATLDGERIPAGEADERAVALDLVPTELLESVVVTKTLTPAMDGDAVGGTIDLVTRRPPGSMGRRGSASLGAGVDDESDGGRALGAASWGAWLEPKRLGASVSASRLDADRGVDSVATLRDDGEPVETRQQDHTVERSRSGVAASFEWLPAEPTSVLVRSLWSEFVDLERRRARVLRSEASEEDSAPATSLASELKDRREWQTVESLSLSASHRHGDWLLQPRASWSRGEEADPTRLDTIFVLDGEGEDEGEYVLEGFRTESDRSSNEDLVASFDLSRAFGTDGRRGTWQAGVKVREKDLRRDDNLLRFELDDDAEPVLLSDVAEPWRPADPFFGGDLGSDSGFGLGAFADPHAARELFARLGLEGERDPEEDLGDFEAEEDVLAAYGMAEWQLGDRVSLLAGARWEDTETSYLAREILIGEGDEAEDETEDDAEDDPGGDVELVPVRGGGAYDEILPSLIVRGAVGERDVLRAAIGRSLSRPGLEYLAPSRLVVPEEREIVEGNPALLPTTSWNLDLQWQRSLEPLGSLSVSLYAKVLDDVIALVATDSAGDDGEPFTILQPRNAGDAAVRGVELSYRNRFRGALDGFGLHANLTWAEADAELQGRPAMSLPGQADVSGSLVLSYEGSRLSLRLLYSHRDDILEELGDVASEDVYLEARSQLDLSLQVRTGHRWSVFADAFNLTREDVHRYEGTPSRPIFEERVGWWMTAGVRFDL